MTGLEFRVPTLFDYVATFAWAWSGALVGIHKRFDIVGVFVIAMLSSTGGGLIRDGFLLHRTPSLLTDHAYLPLILTATILMSLFARGLSHLPGADSWKKLVDLIDAIGTPAFALIGMQLAQDQGIPVPGVLLVGIINGTGGGLLRDVVVGDVPALLRPGQFSSLSLLAVCVLFQVLTREFRVFATQAALITVAAYFVIRVLTVRFN